MSDIFEQMAGLDKLLHEPARLAILTALSACQSADYTFLQRITGMTQGNLSGHLTKLEEAGMVKIEKQFVEKRPNTVVSITPQGTTSIEQHWQHLLHLRDSAKDWKPEKF